MSSTTDSPDAIKFFTWVVSEITPEVAVELDQMESDFQKELEEEGRGEGGWQGKFHCAAEGYMPRPRLYDEGRGSFIFEARSSASPSSLMGAYVISMRRVFWEGKELSLVYGYFARVLPAARGQGLNVKFYSIMTKFCISKGFHFALGVIARDNISSLKGQLRSNPATGYDFFAEQVLYVLPTSATTTMNPPSVADAVRSELSDVGDAAALFARIYDHDGLSLVDVGSVMTHSQHAGHFVLRKGESAAGISLWRPNYAHLVAPDGAQSHYTLYYNPWVEGALGEQLFQDLTHCLLRQDPFPYVIFLLMRHVPAAVPRPHQLEGIPSYEPNPLEQFVRPHALGFEEELILGGFLSFMRDQRRMNLPITKPLSYDPRDVSSLLCFHPFH